MANQWPNAPLQNAPSEQSLKSPHEVFDDWNNLYTDIFSHTMSNPTANAPARYVMNLMYKANETINQLVSKNSGTSLPRTWPEVDKQTDAVSDSDSNTTAPEASPSPSPNTDPYSPKSWQKFLDINGDILGIAGAGPDRSQLELWKALVNAWNHDEETWETKSECEEACVLGMANHLTYDNDSTTDYEPDSPEHIAESLDGGSDDETEETEIDYRYPVPSPARCQWSEEASERSEARDNVAYWSRVPNAGSSTAQSGSTEEYMWDPDQGEFVMVSHPYQTFGFFPPSRVSEDTSSTEAPAAPGEFLGYFGGHGTRDEDE